MSGPALREAIERLIAISSISAVDPAIDQGNRAVIDALAGWLEDGGFRVEVLPLAEDPSRKANLIATRGRGEGGLVLAGHSDTVPFDEGRWSSDPFRATERDGKIYGLGTSDMKSFLALAMEAARAFDERDLAAPLIILATADEESGMDGARALVEAGRPRARHAVIGEPTGLRPVRMHKGCAMERLELVGRSGHSSDPRHGVSALDGMYDAIGELVALREELARDHHRAELMPPVPTLNLGRIAGGDNPNRICASCLLDYDVRLLPGMQMSAVRREISSRVQRRLQGRGLEIRSRALVSEVEPFETDPSAALVRAAEQLTGHAAEAVSFGTEAPFLTKLGAQTIVLGPGDIAVAHQPDEHLPLDRIDPMLSILRSLIQRFCIEEPSA